MTQRRSAFIKDMFRHPLFLLAIFLIAGFAILGSVSDGRFDPVTLAVISATYTFSCISMAVRTKFRMWSLLGAGLLATMTGDALFYAYLYAGTQHWTFLHHAGVLDAVRDLFFVGSLFVCVGLGGEWIKDRGNGVFTAKRWRRNRPDTNRQGEEGAAS